ncbi:MAG: bifunctional DNA primase/polymerase [Syntrophales bacterium]|nr:bifunctional DNA primase/polymerase [Syntrophales bacterium]
MTDSSILKAALGYRAKGFSVIPIRGNKKPFLDSWKEYQERRATENEIREWWNQYPSAMIGIVTGPVSGICAVDIDRYAQDYNEATEFEYFPDGLVTPTCETPRGGTHLYFKFPEDSPLTINARGLPGIDFRGDGGYIIAPPSKNGTGRGYRWAEGLSLDDVQLQPLPMLYSNYLNTSIRSIRRCSNDITERFQALQNVTDATVSFKQGKRDDSLFHVANCLIKGGMSEGDARYILDILAHNCSPPFSPQEAQVKIDSALQRAKRRERNIQKEVEEWVSVTTGYWNVTECCQALQCVTKEEKTAVRVAVHRLYKAENIEKHGSRNGVYRTVDTQCEDIDFRSVIETPLDIKWPFRIEELVQIMPGNIVIVADEPNAGKTAFLLNLVKENMSRHEIYYFSSEMGAMEMKKRLSKFEMPLEQWRFHPKERTSNFADVIKPNAINVIDFLEVYDEFYKIGGLIKEIYDKLNNGIAVIAIQKNKGADYGLGGGRGLEKARLYLTMEPGKARIVKAKNWKTFENPNGMIIDFKLAQGCKFFTDKGWHR